MKNKTNLFDKLGLVVAIGGLILAYHSFRVQNEFSRKTEISSSQPLLNIEFLKADVNEKYGFLLKNIGSGSAVIEEFKVYTNKENYINDIPREQWVENGGFWFDTVFFYEDVNVLNKGYGVPTVDRGNVYLLATRALNLEQIKSGRTQFSDRGGFFGSLDAKILGDTIIEISYKSFNSLDTEIYVLTFSESFIDNNIRGEILDKSTVNFEW